MTLVCTCLEANIYECQGREDTLFSNLTHYWGFPGTSAGKESACNAGDLGSIPGLGRSPGEGNVTHSSTLAWKIPGTEEPGRLQSMGLQRIGHD